MSSTREDCCTPISPDSKSEIELASVHVEEKPIHAAQWGGQAEKESEISITVKGAVPSDLERELSSPETLRRQKSWQTRARAAPSGSYQHVVREGASYHNIELSNIRKWSISDYWYTFRNAVDLFPYDVDNMVVRTHVRRGLYASLFLSLLAIGIMMASGISVPFHHRMYTSPNPTIITTC